MYLQNSVNFCFVLHNNSSFGELLVSNLFDVLCKKCGCKNSEKLPHLYRCFKTYYLKKEPQKIEVWYPRWVFNILNFARIFQNPCLYFRANMYFKSTWQVLERATKINIANSVHSYHCEKSKFFKCCLMSALKSLCLLWMTVLKKAIFRNGEFLHLQMEFLLRERTTMKDYFEK